MPDSAREVLRLKAHDQQRALAVRRTGLRLYLPLWRHLPELLIHLLTLLFLETRRCYDLLFHVYHMADSL
jgi:hypothetical protein